MDIDNDYFLIENGVLKEYRVDTANKAIPGINIPEGVKELADGVFENKNLSEIVLPSSLEKIGAFAFRNTHIKKIIIPYRVKSIGDYAFAGNNIECLIFKGNNLSIGKYAFDVSMYLTIEMSSKLMKQLISDGNLDLTHFKSNNGTGDANFIIDCNGEKKDTVFDIIWYLYRYQITYNITLKNVLEEDIDFYLSRISTEKNPNKTIIFETYSKRKEDKIVYHFGYYYNNNTVLKKCISIKEKIILPDNIDNIDSHAFENCYAKTLILPKRLESTFLYNGNIENIGIYANGNEFWFSHFNKLKSIRFLSSDSPTLNISYIPDRDFDIYMSCGDVFGRQLEIYERSNLRIHIDFSNCDSYFDFINCLNGINHCFNDATIYCYNVSPIWIMRCKVKDSRILNNYYVYKSKKSFSEYFNINIDNKEDVVNSVPRYRYSPLIQERIDKIKSLIEPINDDEENSITDILNNLLEKYEDDRENFKPTYGSSSEFNLSVGPQSIRDLDINLMNKLDIIINKLKSSTNYINLLKEIDEYVKKVDKENIQFDASNELDTKGKINNILWYNSLIKNSKRKDEFKKELLEILKSISTSVSKELKMTFKESITLTNKNVDYNTLLDESIDELYHKAMKYCCWLEGSIDNSIDSVLAKSINNTRVLISLLDEERKDKLSKDFDEIIEKIKSVDLSLSEEEITEYADELLKPIREELDRNAYYSIKLKKIIDGINASLELLKTGEVVYEDTDIITDTVNEILTVTPQEIHDSVVSELLNLIIKWNNNIKNKSLNIAPSFDNMNGYSKSLLDTIEEYKLLFSEYSSSDIKVFKMMEEEARKGFIEVSISSDEIKYIELFALHLTILKDLYAVKYKVESYIKEKEQYEKDISFSK